MSPRQASKVEALFVKLQRDFPRHFASGTDLPLPWNRRIRMEIIDFYGGPLRISNSVVRSALGRCQHLYGERYQEAVSHHRARYHLDGSVATRW